MIIGSSPLARGLLDGPRLRGRISGIIPARAGFTGFLGGRILRSTDHPRSRGVYAAVQIATLGGRGSSPLARGLRAADFRVQRPLGIIPARAGFTSPPRVPATCTGGSSPLARGLQALGMTINQVLLDHPRSRGVYTRLLEDMALARGSSPLARGLHEMMESGDARVRIIPARAGFTKSPTFTKRPKMDHPRSRGVYRASICASYSVRGSSPLARGLRPAAEPKGKPKRIIPARAGFTPPGRVWR
mgnify:CR=1 FL=1